MILADDDLDINAEIAGRAQNLNHTAHRAFTVFRVLQQLDVYDHAVELRRIGHSQRLGTDAVDPFSRSGDRQVFRNLDPVVQAVVMRNHQKPVAAHLELANHGRMRPLQNLDDFAIRAAASLDARKAQALFSAPDILAVGFVVSFVSGLAAVAFLIRFVRTHSLDWFVVYRLLLAAVVALTLLFGYPV